MINMSSNTLILFNNLWFSCIICVIYRGIITINKPPCLILINNIIALKKTLCKKEDVKRQAGNFLFTNVLKRVIICGENAREQSGEESEHA